MTTFLTQRTGLAALALALLAASGVQAQDYPTKPIRLVAPFPAGSGPDANAREIGAELTKILGQTVFVENRPGASSIIGTDFAAKAAPDGYTLLVGTTTSMSVLPHLYAKLPFNVEKDFAPISLLGVLNTGLIAHPGTPFKTARELVAHAKAQPDSVTVATQGIGSYSHLSGEWFGASSGGKLRFVPYNTNSPYSDLLAGQVNVMFDGLPAAAGNLRGGKLKLLAITGKARHAAFPDVPTFAEAGLPDYAPLAWQGLLAPAGTPKPILDKLSAAMQKATQNPQLAEKWRMYGGELKATSPAEFAAFIKADSAMWGQVVRQAGVKLD
ncbi:MAG: tripartite tricarboxylate transporter substrate binding protein [Burkholderiaceae bacterium]|jgi:tripartite-type tricarboxylate transporter receptor subunit TctC|nr:tripartite tricarboxylate transporter substrate binding protein [Polaromonas sp.]MDO8776067.1 tripartite tricarboxylate transporter substrate binding protein [Burkholderiaceae bacterium]